MSNLEQAQKIIDIMRHHGERMKHCNKYKRDDTYLYIIHFAFISEIGEIFDKIIKASRDDWSHEKFAEGVKKEIGDVFWYLCQGILEHPDGNGEILVDVFQSNTILEKNTQKAGFILLEACDPFASFSDNLISLVDFVYEDFLGVYEPLTESKSIVDRIQSILDENYAKVISRYERGVISGSGDNR